MKCKNLIIIGGGASIQEALPLSLWDKIKNLYTFGINYSYSWIIPTCQIFLDYNFYNKNIDGLSSLPMVIGQKEEKITKINPNTILVPCSNSFDRTIKMGIYNRNLSGLFSLTLGIALNNVERIFLLGCDGGPINQNKDSHGRRITHFYQSKIEHRGIGKLDYYFDKNKMANHYKVYENIKDIKIYNVSPNSRIHNFEKIDYNTFFSLVDNTPIDQNEMRAYIKSFLYSKFNT